MAKTYADLTVANATAGNAILASDFTTLFTNSNNYRRPPLCVLERTTLQTIANNTDTRVQFGSAAIDTDGMATTGASAKITIQTAGVYLVTISASWSNASATGARSVAVWKNNGTATRLVGGDLPGSTAATVVTHQSGIVSLVAGDTLDPYVFQNSGGNLDIVLNAGIPAARLSVAWIGQAT